MRKWMNKDTSGIKVTVIIPVYNVEKYLRKCLDSVISQSHKNLQIIIVDDGSTDGSSEICDEYAKQDSRIQVVHKRNGGLSSARNVALDIAEGTYILFVDSDDWLPAGAIKREVQVITGENVRFLFFKYGYSYDGKTYPKYYPTWKNVLVLNQKRLLTDYYIPKKYILGSNAWNKIYHASIWKERRFQEGILFEDDNIMLSILLDIEKAVFLNEFGYVQYKREGSITQTEFNHKKMILLENVLKDLERIEQKFGIESVYYTYTQIKLWQRALSVLEDIQEYCELHDEKDVSEQMRSDIEYCIEKASEMEQNFKEKSIPKECKEQYEECKRLMIIRMNYFRNIVEIRESL